MSAAASPRPYWRLLAALMCLFVTFYGDGLWWILQGEHLQLIHHRDFAYYFFAVVMLTPSNGMAVAAMYHIWCFAKGRI